MRSAEELQREIEALRERFSRLIEVSLRINESLHFETVVQDVLDSTRALTGPGMSKADYQTIATGEPAEVPAF